MKKILLVAMVAFAFMACNEGASVPSSDKKAVKTVTAEAPALLGETAATVDKKLQAAGYSKADGALALTAKRAIQARAPKKLPAGLVEVLYIYNLPTDYQQMSEAEANAYITNLLDKGECLAMVVAMYVDDTLVILSTSVIAPIKEDINLLYTSNSDGLFKKLPAIDNMYTYWSGYNSSGDKEYTDHAQFVADIAAVKAVEAEEYGATVKIKNMETGEGEGFGYSCFWNNPTEEEQAEMRREEGFVSAMGGFSVADYAFLNTY